MTAATRSTLKTLIAHPDTAIHALRQGLPIKRFDELLERLEITQAQLTGILRIPPSTLARRRNEERLSPEESDRLYRLAHLHSLATQVLGDEARASTWLKTAKRALGNASPLELADTEPGVKSVETLLHQIEHGLFI